MKSTCEDLLSVVTLVDLWVVFLVPSTFLLFKKREGKKN